MYFSLEALEAKHGDCLILHYGQVDDPKILLIDGGPSGVFEDNLKPRLLQIREALTPDEPLPLSMVMVSHMDADHVVGILKMVEELKDDVEDDHALNFDIQHMWFNTFDDIVGNDQIAAVSGFSNVASVADLDGVVPQLKGLDTHIKAFIASTKQGRDLRDAADFLTIPLNTPFQSLEPGKPALVRGDAQGNVLDWGDGLAIRVIHPDQARLLEMQEKWDADLKKAKEKGDDSIIIASAGSRDRSPFNLASIVCLAEFDGKRMLLTGDARDDDILEGLERENLLDDNGHIHVDILKIPHHGSDKNVSRRFFERVTADHYIISGDGRHHNPERATLIMLSDATAGDDTFTIHFTNHEGSNNLKAVLDAYIAAEQAQGRSFGVDFRPADAPSLTVNLLQDIVY